MKNVLKIWALAAFVPVAVMAQTSLDEEVNAELEKMYQTQQVPQAQRSAGPAVQVNVQAQPQAAATQSNLQSANQLAEQSQLAAQKQPTTVIQATPLIESKADLIRKSRQDAELSTEQTIVEKLEEARLMDEKKRAEVLFGDKFNTMTNSAAQQPAVQAPVTVTPVVPVMVPEQVVQPLAAEKAKEETLDREAIRGEVTAALAEFKKEDEKPKLTSYFSVMTGMGEYPDAINVQGEYSLGVAFGRKISERVIAEGSFMYSNFQVEQPAQYGNGASIYNYQTGTYDYYPRITEMNQYSTSGLVKYQMLGGSFRPEVGGLMSYTYRTFSDEQFALSDATVSSQAIDFGLMAGASLELSEGFALGIEYRHMWNLTNKVEGTTLQKSSIYPGQASYTPIEEMTYYNFSVVGRATF